MGYGVMLQNWVTVRGNTAATVVTQPESLYADLLPFKDCVIFLEVADISGGINTNLDVSPTKDDGLFVTLGGLALPVGVNTIKVIYEQNAPPLARYLRWRLAGGASGAWSQSFRIWIAGNMSGKYRRMMTDQLRQQELAAGGAPSAHPLHRSAMIAALPRTMMPGRPPMPRAAAATVAKLPSPGGCKGCSGG